MPQAGGALDVIKRVVAAHYVAVALCCLVVAISALSLLNSFGLAAPFVRAIVAASAWFSSSFKKAFKAVFGVLDHLWRHFVIRVAMPSGRFIKAAWMMTLELIIRPTMQGGAAAIRGVARAAQATWNVVWPAACAVGRFLRTAIALVWRVACIGGRLVLVYVLQPLDRAVRWVVTRVVVPVRAIGSAAVRVWRGAIVPAADAVAFLACTLPVLVWSRFVVPARDAAVVFAQASWRAVRTTARTVERYILRPMYAGMQVLVLHVIVAPTRLICTACMATGRASATAAMCVWRDAIVPSAQWLARAASLTAFVVRSLATLLWLNTVAPALATGARGIAHAWTRVCAAGVHVWQLVFVPVARLLWVRALTPMAGAASVHRMGLASIALTGAAAALLHWRWPNMALAVFGSANCIALAVQIVSRRYGVFAVGRGAFSDPWLWLARAAVSSARVLLLLACAAVVIHSCVVVPRGVLHFALQTGEAVLGLAIPRVYMRRRWSAVGVAARDALLVRVGSACVALAVTRALYVDGFPGPLALLYASGALLSWSTSSVSTVAPRTVMRLCAAAQLALAAVLTLWHGLPTARGLSLLPFVPSAYALLVLAGCAVRWPPHRLATWLFYRMDGSVIDAVVRMTSRGTLGRAIVRWLRLAVTGLPGAVLALRRVLWTVVLRPFGRGTRAAVLMVWRHPLLAFALSLSVMGGLVAAFAFDVSIVPADLDPYVMAVAAARWLVAAAAGAVVAVGRAAMALFDLDALRALASDAASGRVFASPILATIVYGLACCASYSIRSIVARVYSSLLVVSARQTALTLIGIRKFRRGQMGFAYLEQVPKELVQDIARDVYASRLRDAWTRSVLRTQWG